MIASLFSVPQNKLTCAFCDNVDDDHWLPTRPLTILLMEKYPKWQTG